MDKAELLFIGQAPGKTGSEDQPLEGAIGRRLAGLLSVPYPVYLSRVKRVNLLGFFPGRKAGDEARGDAFPMDKARIAARKMLASGLLHNRKYIVVFGRMACAAFGLSADAEWFAEYPIEGYCLSCKTSVCPHKPTYFLRPAPHPSGLNHWWNEPANRKLAEDFFREVYSSVPWESMLFDISTPEDLC